MYLILYNGYKAREMKAATEQSIRTWMKENGTGSSINYGKLRREGETSSRCKTWFIQKIDGRLIREIDYLDHFVFMDGIVLPLNVFSLLDEHLHQ